MLGHPFNIYIEFNFLKHGKYKNNVFSIREITHTRYSYFKQVILFCHPGTYPAPI